jgi:hypothetical protein
MRAIRLPHLGEGSYVFWLSAALYLALAVVMVLQLHLLVGDAWSRVGNAYYMLFSRDPHLAAIGFVWNPLPSLLVAPLLLFAPLWPPLVQQGFAANLISAFAMAGAVYQLRGVLADWGLGRVVRLLVVILFALHPMIVHYGANGDTEALFILLLLIAVRYVARWMHDGRLGPLVMSGLAVALAYWVRYEAAAVGAGLIIMVAVASAIRSPGAWRSRALTGVADSLIVGLPFVFAFVSWSLASWVIVGNPFEQFQSVYGTTAQLQTGAVFVGQMSRENLLIGQWLGMEPFVAAIFVGSLVAALWKRDWRWIAPATICGAVLAFSAWAWLTERTAGWIRYQIVIVPLASLLAGFLLAHFSDRARPGPFSPSSPVLRQLRAGATVVLRWTLIGAVICSLGFALPSTLTTLQDPVVGRGGREQLDDVPRYLVGREVASYLDKLRLPRGSVLVDVFLGFPIVLSSVNPRQFVITPDRDFKQVLADPEMFGVQYFLVPPSGGLASLDALHRQWPNVYESGGGFGTLIREFRSPVEQSGFDPAIFNQGVVESLRWRLYRIAS